MCANGRTVVVPVADGAGIEALVREIEGGVEVIDLADDIGAAAAGQQRVDHDRPGRRVADRVGESPAAVVVERIDHAAPPADADSIASASALPSRVVTGPGLS